MTTNDKIQTRVGDQMREVDMDLFIEAHVQLADYYRAMGFDGDRLDIAIVEALPHRLAQVLDGTVYH